MRASALAVVLLQAGLITGCCSNVAVATSPSWKRAVALSEVAHLNRTATVGVMSASVAHELNQPLGAILLNTETLDLLLRVDPVDRTEIEEVVAEIRRDDQTCCEDHQGASPDS